MIALTSLDHHGEVYVNPDHILYMRPVSGSDGAFTSIVFVNGGDMRVSDDIKTILHKVAVM